MIRRAWTGVLGAAVVLGGLHPALLADTLKMKDGTHIDGKVMDAGSSGYWVKTPDGTSRTVPKDSVQEWVKGDNAGPAAASASSLAGRGQAAAVPGGAPFAAVKAKADRVDTPVQAVALWQTFIDAHPSPTDAAAAKKELAYWNQLLTGNAERINGKWIWGEEREKLLKQVRELMTQAAEDMKSNQTLKGLKEYEDAVKLYPNDFEGNFWMGRINLEQGAGTRNNAKIDAGIKSLETAVRLRPNSAPALSNLAIAYNFRQKYLLSIQTAYQAAKLEDNKGIVQNLVTVIDHAPSAMANNSKVKPIIADAMVLAGKYGITSGGEWYWVNLDEDEESGDGRPSRAKRHRGGEHDDSEEKGPPGIFSEGTGELVSADGYILTNRHVAKPGDYLMVRLSDGTMKVGDRIAISDDEDLDLAIVKIKTDKPLPFIRLAAYDHPPVGEDVDVFGFPLLGMIGGLDSSVKMTRGIVTSFDANNAYCDVTVDANINPGNSGGPMVDHFGNLLAVTTRKTSAGNIEGEASISSYGLGQSTGRVRRFLQLQAAKLKGLHLTPGTADKVMTNEDLYERMKPITVCVLACRGAIPADGKTIPKPPAQP